VLTARNANNWLGTAGIALNWNGTTGNPITYDGNSAGTWGTGRANFTDNYGSNNITVFQGLGGQHDLVFNSLDLGPVGGSATPPVDTGVPAPSRSGGGIAFYYSCTNITVLNSYFHQFGYYFNVKPMDISNIDGVCFKAQNAVNVVLSNDEFTCANWGAEFEGNKNMTGGVTIVGCNFHNSLTWCIRVAATAAVPVDNFSIHDNLIHDYEEFDLGNWTGYTNPHTDGIMWERDYASIYGSNNNLYNNQFWSTNSAGGGTAAIYVTGGGSANIYNNVFKNVQKGRTIFINGTANEYTQTVNIVNNTTIGNWPLALQIADGSSSQVVRVLNNIYYDTYHGSSTANFPVYATATTNNPMPLWTFNYNDYFTFNPYQLVFQWDPYGYVDLSGDRATWGWETHGQFTDPLFVNIRQTKGAVNANFSGWNLLDLHLRANSPCIGKGVNLSSLGLPGLSADKDGNPRPSSGLWDIGAYQHSTKSPVVTGLSNNWLSVQIGLSFTRQVLISRAITVAISKIRLGFIRSLHSSEALLNMVYRVLGGMQTLLYVTFARSCSPCCNCTQHTCLCQPEQRCQLLC
jgi:hypothetical protein